jgi:hypothetical protein
MSKISPQLRTFSSSLDGGCPNFVRNCALFPGALMGDVQILCANGALFPGALMGDVQFLCANGALFWEGFCPWFRELQEHRALGLLRTFYRALRLLRTYSPFPINR